MQPRELEVTMHIRIRFVADRAARVVASLTILLTLAACSNGNNTGTTDTVPSADAVAIDADGNTLGSVRFPTSCTVDAQPILERGLALLHHMNYIKAKHAFLQASDIDAECAIAYWGGSDDARAPALARYDFAGSTGIRTETPG